MSINTLKRREQVKEAQQRHRQKAKDKRLLINFRDFLERHPSEAGSLAVQFRDFFDEITWIVQSRTYAEWFSELPFDKKEEFFEGVFSSTDAVEADKMIEKLYKEVEQSRRIGVAVATFSKYATKRFHRLGSIYKRMRRGDIRKVYSRLGLEKVEFGVEKPPSFEAISKKKFKQACSEVITERETKEKNSDDLLSICKRGRTRKFLLHLAGYAPHASFRPQSKRTIARLLEKRGVVICKNNPEHKKDIVVELTDLGRSIVSIIREKKRGG